MRRSVSIVSRLDARNALIRRISAEYLEMPGLRVTASQAQRLFGLDATTCDNVLETLLQSGFLSRTSDGMFTLAPAGDRNARPR